MGGAQVAVVIMQVDTIIVVVKTAQNTFICALHKLYSRMHGNNVSISASGCIYIFTPGDSTTIVGGPSLCQVTVTQVAGWAFQCVSCPF